MSTVKQLQSPEGGDEGAISSLMFEKVKVKVASDLLLILNYKPVAYQQAEPSSSNRYESENIPPVCQHSCSATKPGRYCKASHWENQAGASPGLYLIPRDNSQ